MSTQGVPLDSTQGSAVHCISALVDEMNANEPQLNYLFHDSISDIDHRTLLNREGQMKNWPTVFFDALL